jgi:hypothetical protein
MASPLVYVLVLTAALLIVWLLRRGGTDITWKTLDSNLDWSASESASLAKVYDYVVSFADNTILWYQSRRRPKRQMGVFLRLSALLLTAGAGLVPLSPDLFGVMISPVWSTVMLAAAGLFVSIDILVGSTSGWVRYMLSQQRVERLRDAFLMEWNALKVAKTDTAGMLDRARLFLLAVGKVVDDETQEWATEFQNALKEMEKARKAEAEIPRTGALEVTVTNAHVVTDWSVEVDGNQRGRTSGKNVALTDVPVGLRKVRVHGEDAAGKRFSDEKTVKVDGGTVVSKEFVLS